MPPANAAAPGSHRSPHSQVFKTLAAMPARSVRYVPWLPYPRLAVPALNPPSGTALCDGLPVAQGYPLSLR
jgi:hypothetical protein